MLGLSCNHTLSLDGDCFCSALFISALHLFHQTYRMFMSRFYTLKQLSHPTFAKVAVLAVAAVFLGACTVYKPPITQGNILTAEQVSSLKVGMTRQQVQQALGSPLLQDVFNTNRWDYIYRSLKSDGNLEQRVMTIIFDADGKLSKWSGEIAPNQNEISLKTDTPTFLSNQAPIAVEAPIKLDSQVLALIQNLGTDTPKPTPTAPVITPNVSTVVIAPLVNPAAVQTKTIPSATLTPVAAPVMPVTATAIAIQAAPKDTPQKSVSPMLPAEFQALIEKKIADWRAAWLAKDIAAYAAHYAVDFAGDLPNHAAWLAKRQRVITDSSNLSITLSDIKVIQTSNTEARASFKQVYATTQFSQTGSKSLFFQRMGDNWHIVAEVFLKQS
jgi:outer membrane protein assembly factor BamE